MNDTQNILHYTTQVYKKKGIQLSPVWKLIYFIWMDT